MKFYEEMDKFINMWRERKNIFLGY